MFIFPGVYVLFAAWEVNPLGQLATTIFSFWHVERRTKRAGLFRLTEVTGHDP